MTEDRVGVSSRAIFRNLFVRAQPISKKKNSPKSLFFRPWTLLSSPFPRTKTSGKRGAFREWKSVGRKNEKLPSGAMGQANGVVMVVMRSGNGGADAAGIAAVAATRVPVMVVVDAFVGLRSSCRPTPGLSVLMLETRSTLDPREQAGEGERDEKKRRRRRRRGTR